MDKDIFSFRPEIVKARELEKKKADSIAALITLLQTPPEPCAQCRTLEAMEKVNLKTIDGYKQDLRNIRLACMKVFKAEGYNRSLAIKGLLAVIEEIYGRPTITRFGIKFTDEQAFNEYKAEQRRCYEAADRMTDTCAAIKKALRKCNPPTM